MAPGTSRAPGVEAPQRVRGGFGQFQLLFDHPLIRSSGEEIHIPGARRCRSRSGRQHRVAGNRSRRLMICGRRRPMASVNATTIARAVVAALRRFMVTTLPKAQPL
jgi:hypothetical protein